MHSRSDSYRSCFYSPASPHQSRDKKNDHVPLTSQHDTVASFVLFRFTSCPSSTTLPLALSTHPREYHSLPYPPPARIAVAICPVARRGKGRKVLPVASIAIGDCCWNNFPNILPPPSDSNQLSTCAKLKVASRKISSETRAQERWWQNSIAFWSTFFSFSLLDTSGDELLVPKKKSSLRGLGLCQEVY